jgi:hypothetical protein
MQTFLGTAFRGPKSPKNNNLMSSFYNLGSKSAKNSMSNERDTLIPGEQKKR